MKPKSHAMGHGPNKLAMGLAPKLARAKPKTRQVPRQSHNYPPEDEMVDEFGKKDDIYQHVAPMLSSLKTPVGGREGVIKSGFLHSVL